MSRSDEHGPLVDLGNERPQLPARARNLSPIVPRASISGRALVAVVAIMTFLASITTGAVLLVSSSAAEWQSDVSSEITIQVRPQAGELFRRQGSQNTAPLLGNVRCRARVVAEHVLLEKSAPGAPRCRRQGFTPRLCRTPVTSMPVRICATAA